MPTGILVNDRTDGKVNLYQNYFLNSHVAIYFVTIAEIGFSGDRYPQRASDHSLNLLGIDDAYLDEIEDEVEEEIRKAEVFLRL